jgi:hypothetical protein
MGLARLANILAQEQGFEARLGRVEGATTQQSCLILGT